MSPLLNSMPALRQLGQGFSSKSPSKQNQQEERPAVSAHTGSMQIPSANGPETLLLKGSLN